MAGFARYKRWMADGLDRLPEVGPVLGPLHPVVAENIALLRHISGARRGLVPQRVKDMIRTQRLIY